VGVACPGYREILQSSLAGQFDRVGITGVVKVTIRIKGNQIVEVQPVSGPREYYRAVQSAVRRFSCSAQGADELPVTLEVSFKEQ
jgi:protein TonB